MIDKETKNRIIGEITALLNEVDDIDLKGTLAFLRQSVSKMCYFGKSR